MSDTATITTNVADGTALTSNITEGVQITSNVVESTTVTASVTTGAKGDKGDTGAASTVPGPAGTNGTDGSDGKTILSGAVDPTTEGVDGDFYINTTNDTIFGPKASGAWGTATSIVGPTGATGAAGVVQSVNGISQAAVVLTQDNVGDGTTYKQYSDTEKTKLSGIEASANNYTHPATHSADILTDGTTNKAYTATEQSKLSGIATGANVGVVPNAGITGATKTKITYDAKGLVTSGADATTADIADSLNKRYVTDANLTTIGNQSGTNSGDNATNSQYSGLAASKADDSAVVHKTGAETIAGDKTFSNNVATGGATPTHALDVAGSPASTTELVNLTNNTAGAYTFLQNMLAPNITAGQIAYITLGKAASSNNRFAISYSHVDDGSLKNSFNIQPYGANSVFDVACSGEITTGAISNMMRTQPFYSWDYHAAGVATANFSSVAVASGTAAYVNTLSAHPGYMTITSSTTTNSGTMSYLFGASNLKHIEGGDAYECIFSPKVASNTNTTIRCGFLDSTTSSDAVDGAYFELPAGSFNIVGKTSSNSTRTTSATIATLAVDTWYRLRIVVNAAATSATFTVYDSTGASIGTQTNSANLPTASGRECGVGFIATNVGTSAILLAWLDYQAVQMGSISPYVR